MSLWKLILTLILQAAIIIASFDADLNQKYLTLPRAEFIAFFNQQNYTWKIENTTQNHDVLIRKAGGVLINDYMRNKLPTLDVEGVENIWRPQFSERFQDKVTTSISSPTIIDQPSLHTENSSFIEVKLIMSKSGSPNFRTKVLKTRMKLPKTFDAREQWPHCTSLRDIINQSHCSSCWAVASASVISDRLCIQTGNSVSLSAQDFECCRLCFGDKSSRCEKGGDPVRAFHYWSKHGLASEECKPYNVSKFTLGKCQRHCENGALYDKKTLKSKLYWVNSTERNIKAELFKNGPILAIIEVYTDIYDHTGIGVYEHKFGNEDGYHAVRIIGYGDDNAVPYWLIANSWGRKWGIQGTFKINRNYKFNSIDLLAMKIKM